MKKMMVVAIMVCAALVFSTGCSRVMVTKGIQVCGEGINKMIEITFTEVED